MKFVEFTGSKPQRLGDRMDAHVEKRRKEQGEDLEAVKDIQRGLETQMTKVLIGSCIFSIKSSKITLVYVFFLKFNVFF